MALVCKVSNYKYFDQLLMCLLVVNLFIDIVFFLRYFFSHTYVHINSNLHTTNDMSMKTKNKTKHVFIKKFSFQTPNKRNKFVNTHTNVFSTSTPFRYKRSSVYVVMQQWAHLHSQVTKYELQIRMHLNTHIRFCCCTW